MKLFKYKKSKAYKFEVKRSLDEFYGEYNYNIDDVLNFLCEHGGEYPLGHYDVIKYPKVNTNIIQRLNVFWVYPIMGLLICPLKWLITGRSGFKPDSKMLKILQFLLGDMR
jgi:hypothetical protein